MDRAVIATASELFECRHYPGVVAMCSDALENEPECVPLLVIRARAHIALRRDLDAQADLREIIRLDPQCGVGYRLLGELAARRDENQSAAIFFREALRLDPDDREAAEWLLIIASSIRPVAGASQFPAPAPAAGRVLSTRAPRPESVPDEHRLARGTRPPDANEERPTRPFARGAGRPGYLVQAPAPAPAPDPEPEPVRVPTETGSITPLPPPPNFATRSRPPSTLAGRPLAPAPAKQAPRVHPRPITRGITPELPGFGDYLVTSGILTRERLRAAQAYQRSMKVQLATAIVTLGLATPQRIEWAAVAHQSQLPRPQ